MALPTLVLLAGPNGAGKTTYINGFLRERAEAFQFVNPDAASLSRRERIGSSPLPPDVRPNFSAIPRKPAPRLRFQPLATCPHRLNRPRYRAGA